MTLKMNCPLRRAGRNTGNSTGKNGSGLATAVAIICIIVAFSCFFLFRGQTQLCYPSQVAAPIAIGLVGAVAGILAKSPWLSGINLSLAFFLMPLDLLLFGNLF
ncbi:putative membrane protein [Corynebacterium deserti GIMN1.010]|uniref:Putative membrane protein n=1 Tax=Corynebacterium deserti GIMN1.010 TaxID=931089 RepID=A0A0M5IL43_9CORY|nr:hypothetical protein [Corynebacterium deserti]ALC04656.1 putative membrane protein [Corynebacterium deserti GIMN1.010]